MAGFTWHDGAIARLSREDRAAIARLVNSLLGRKEAQPITAPPIHTNGAA